MPSAPPNPDRDTFAQDVCNGLVERPKSLEPKYFYDAIGSELFEAITHQPEYYLTRTEAALLARCAPELGRLMGDELNLVELGSGSSAKTTILLDSFLDTHDNIYYLPIDISPTILTATARRLDRRYPELDVTPIVSQYEAGLRRASTIVAEDEQRPDRMLVLFLGSSIGNMEPSDARQFVEGLGRQMEPEDALLIGFDLQKDPAILHAAYNDAAGVTARFNRNILHRINHELEGGFDVEAFSHSAFYDEAEGRVEMHLRAETEQEVAIGACGRSFHFDRHETIHTENSYKYIPEWIDELAERTDFRVRRLFTDDKNWFALALFEPI